MDGRAFLNKTPQTNDKAWASEARLSDPQCHPQMIPCIPVIAWASHANLRERHCEGDWKHLEARTCPTAHRFYLCGIKHGQMTVCCHGAVAVFEIGILQISKRGERGWQYWLYFSIGLYIITHASQGDAAHFPESISPCKCPLCPNCAPDHSIKQNEESQTRWGRSIKYQIFPIIMFFFSPHSLPLHMIRALCCSPPPHLSMNPPRQKDKLPSGLLF